MSNKRIFVYQGYTQQPSETNDDTVITVLCDVFESKSFGKTFLIFKPVNNELLDTSDSDSTGDVDSTDTEQN